MFSLNSSKNITLSSPELITFPLPPSFYESKKSNHFYMCQTSSLISQTKAGEFDLSEFRSFVPMNKTSLLLDVTRTYQVTDSPFELGGDTVQEPLRRTRPKRWSLYCISSAFGLRGKITAQAARYTGMCNIRGHDGDWLWIGFWWIMHSAKREKQKKEKESRSFISSVMYNLHKSLQLCKKLDM